MDKDNKEICCCCCKKKRNRKNKKRKGKCRGSACRILRKLANKPGTIEVMLLNQGTNSLIDLAGDDTPTIFTLVKFDRKHCTAVFTYTVLDAQLQTFKIGCNDLAGVVRVDPSDFT